MHLSAHEEVTRLLDQMRAVSNNPVIARCSDQLEILCRGYMEPDVGSEGMALGMTKSRAKMFDLLLARRGQTVSRGALMDASYHNTVDGPEEKIIDVQICNIRKTLKDTQYEIETVFGIGYRLLPAQPNAMAA